MNRVRAVAGLVILELFRRKDIYVLFILTALITLLLGSVTFFEDTKIVRYLKEICLALIWLSSLVIAIGTAARQFPAEREGRTIMPLLAKPISRAEVAWGKFLGAWAACGAALLLFYGFFALLIGLREGGLPVWSYVQAFTLHWTMLAVLVSLTLLGSLLTTSTASNATISFLIAAGILLLGRHLNLVALGLPEPGRTCIFLLYQVLPHLELFDIRDLLVHNWPPVPFLIWLGALAYGVAYTGFFMLLVVRLFRRTSLA